MTTNHQQQRRRGIRNSSGVACHLSCALQLLLRTILPLQEALLHLKSCNAHGDISTLGVGKDNRDPEDSSSFFTDLATFCRELVVAPNTENENDTADAIDPTKFYRKCSKILNINENDVGDASTAVIRILQRLLSHQEWKSLLESTVYGSQTRQVLVGKQQKLSEETSTIIKRTKQGKIKLMGVPFVLCGQYASFEEGLRRSFEPQSIDGYNWDRPGQTYEEEESMNEGSEEEKNKWKDSPRSWVTSKTVEWHAVSPFWLVQLERFEYQEGERVLLNANVEVPERIDLAQYLVRHDSDSHKFLLLGGICHVVEGSVDEEGHYVSIVRSLGSTPSEVEQWTMFSDETCTDLSTEQALSYLSGIRDENGLYFCGMLLLYGSLHSSTCTSIQTSLALLKEKITEHSKEADRRRGWVDPTAIVGRRLRVRWAKGKFYAGMIVSYDNSSGKHRIKYDDGDEKEYILAKKTIEWLE